MKRLEMGVRTRLAIGLAAAVCFLAFVAISLAVLPVPATTVGQATDGPAQVTINATVRDFKIDHPDFEPATVGFVTGLVRTSLGADGKPVLAEPYGRGSITGPETFSQWYNDVPGVNLRTTLPLTLTETSPGSGIFRFSNTAFFPIDGQLWGNEGLSHNYHFTLELHTYLTYQGGESLSFTSHDDLWAFINHQLAIDLGGVHPATSDSVDLDTLGLTPGQTYPLDLFFAQRHTVGSVLDIETTSPPPATVGGIAELPPLASAPGGSGMGGATYAVLAGAAGVLAFAVLATLSVKRRGVK